MSFTFRKSADDIARNASVIASIGLRKLELPLSTPYWSMISTIHAFDPIVVEVRTRDGAFGIGECVIVPGYTHETLEQSWAFCAEQADKLIGTTLAQAVDALRPHCAAYSHAVTSMTSAFEMASGHSLLQPSEIERQVPLLAPLHSKELNEIPNEIEKRISEGYRAIKVKVGLDPKADLERVNCIQRAAAGRVLIRLDANQGFSSDAACRFASGLDPAGIELLEQPCAAADWDAALRVKQISTVPMMLDESIFGESDIERAAKLKAADYIKLKLVKAGGIESLQSGLDSIRRNNMHAVLGNGVATEISNWMEACVSAGTIERAGEMNGFLKSTVSLFRNPLRFENGCIVLPGGYYPEIDFDALDRHTVLRERYIL